MCGPSGLAGSQAMAFGGELHHFTFPFQNVTSHGLTLRTHWSFLFAKSLLGSAVFAGAQAYESRRNMVYHSVPQRNGKMFPCMYKRCVILSLVHLRSRNDLENASFVVWLIVTCVVFYLLTLNSE